MAIFSKGIVLSQHKEPALSLEPVRFLNTPAIEPQRLVPVEDLDTLDPERIITVARIAGIVDERDGKMLYRKLARAKDRASALVVDAIDDEPYVSSKLNPLIYHQDEVLGALRLCRKVTGAQEMLFMVYKHLADLETRIPRSIGGYKVVKVRGGYPAQPSSRQLKRLGSGRRLTVGVGALIHLFRAVVFGVKQQTAFITVAGGCVRNPMNMEVSLGMTVSQVLERCGLTAVPTHIVTGGPMTGRAVLNPDRTVITPITRAVLAFRHSKREYYSACTGCGRCERLCPAGLNPAYIHRLVQNGYYSLLERFDAHLCTGCGTCSYICPSRLDVVGAAQKAKEYAQGHFITQETGDDDDGNE